MREAVTTDPKRLKVLDLGRYLAGPVTATLLGDLGAEVIKVERPGIGDLARRVAPKPADDPDGISYEYMIEARNKRSITLDYSKPEGADLLRELVRWADILIENFTPGTMKKWGLDYEALREVNPRLVYVAVSAYGQTGPYSGRPGFDFVASGFAGLMHATGVSDGPPTTIGYAVADMITPAFAALGAIEAIRRRDVPGGTGVGELVDIGLYESVLRLATPFIPLYMRDGRLRDRESSRPRHDGAAALATWGYTFRTKDDRWIVMMAPRTDEMRALFSSHAGEAIPSEPVHDARAFFRIWTEYCLRHDRETILAWLLDAEVPVGPVNTIADIVADPQVRHRNLVTLDDHRGEPITMQGIVPRLTSNPGEIHWTGEPLGASNADVFRDLLGVDQARYDALRERNII
jgi:crotonobetainyl-CoA:carnitine CoA-transferase CaiB-like acyl-CoA transferase